MTPLRVLVIALVACAMTAAARASRHPTDAPGVRVGHRRRPVTTTAALRRSRSTRPRTQIEETVSFGHGPAVRYFVLREPAGTIKVLRLIVPDGDRARLDGVIPGVAEVTVTTTAQPPNPVCNPGGGSTICSEQEEQCPMPAAAWRFRLQKITGPGGTIRVQFEVA